MNDFSAAPIQYRPDPLPMAPIDPGSPVAGLARIPDLGALPSSSSPFPAAIPAPATVEQRRSEVSAAAAARHAELQDLPNREVYRNAAVTRRTGAGVESSTGIERDLATLSFDAIREKYGNEVGEGLIRGLISASNEFGAQRGSGRTTENVLSDSVSGVGLGVANAVGGIAALSLGLLNSDAGVAAARGLQSLNQSVQGTQSIGLQNRRTANARQNALDARDNRQSFEAERGEDGDLMAGLRRIGRDFVDTARNTLEDPALIGDTVSQGVGSLLTAGPLGRVLSGTGQVATAAAPEAVTRGLAALGSRLPAAARISPTTGAIGLMEAGGSFQQSAAEISEMSEERLLAGSEEYRALRDQGLDHEEARTLIANRTGLAAASLTAPVAVAAGRLVSRFEANPLRVSSARTAAQNIGLEGIEETIQSAAGQGAQNLAARLIADSTRDLSEGVGEQAALGLVGGLGTAAAVQAPGLAGRGAAGAARTAGQAALAVIAGRADRVREENENTSAVADRTVAAAAQEAAAQAPQNVQAIAQGIQEAEASPAQREEANTFVENLLSVNVFEPEMFANEGVPASVQSALSGSTDNLDAMKRLASMIEEGTAGDADTVTAALLLRQMAEIFEEVSTSDPEALTKLAEDHPARQLVAVHRQLVTDIKSSRRFKAALNLAQKAIEGRVSIDGQSPALQPVTAESLPTPAGQQNLQNHISLAHFVPERANREAVSQILAHHEAGRLRLTDGQLASLKAARALLDSIAIGGDTKQGVAAVTRQLYLNEDTEDALPSATTHIKRVVNAMRHGKPDEAAQRLREFGRLVRHFQNKLGALNAHVEAGAVRGKEPSYKALNPRKGVWYDSKDLPVLHLKNANSIALAQGIAQDSARLVALYNNLAEAFPELGVKTARSLDIHPKLRGNPAEIARTYRGESAPTSAGSTAAADTAESTTAAAPASTPSDAASSVEADTGTNLGTNQAANAGTASDTDAETTTQTEAPSTTGTEVATSAAVTEEGREAQPTAPTTPAAGQEVTPTLESVYPKLLGAGEGAAVPNLFLEAFRLPKEMLSRVHGLASPLRSIREALSSKDALRAFVGGEPKASLSEPMAARYVEYVTLGGQLSRVMRQNLTAALEKRFGGDLAKITANPKITGWPNFKVLNITEPGKDGGLVYNRTLLESAILAGLQWALIARQNSQKLDAEDLAEIFDVPEALVSSQGDIVKHMNATLSHSEVVRDLANKIKDYWGLATNPNALEGFEKGVPEAVAKELLRAMAELGWVNTSVVKVAKSGDQVEFQLNLPNSAGERFSILDGEGKGRGQVRSYPRVEVNLSLQDDDPIRTNLSLIEKAVLAKPKDVFYAGETKPPVATHQMNNPMVQNTAEQVQQIREKQKVEFRFNMPVVNFYRLIGREGMTTLFGAGELQGRALNKNHRESLEGQNLAITEAYDTMLAMFGEAEALATEETPVDRVPFRFARNITKLGRLQMLGRYTPQGSKPIREALVATATTLDLSGDNQAHTEAYALGLGQALGIKVHNLHRSVVMRDLAQRLEKFEPITEMLKSWLSGGKLPLDAAQTIRQLYDEAGYGPINEWAFHALLDHARMQLAENPSEFKTSLPLEADGISNGPINAIKMFSTGSFTPEELDNLAKGGLHIRGDSNGPRTMQEQRSGLDLADPSNVGREQVEPVKNDLYATGAEAMQGFTVTLREQLKSLAASKDPRESRNGRALLEQLDHLNTLLALLIPNDDIIFNRDTGELRITRGAMKNPMTITIYGSGTRGIASKVVSQLTDEIYARVSRVAQAEAEALDKKTGKPRYQIDSAVAMFADRNVTAEQAREQYALFMSALDALRNSYPVFPATVPPFVKKDPSTPLRGDPERFTFSSKDIENITRNVHEFFVKPMAAGISETVGQSVMANSKLVIAATAAHSIFLEGLQKIETAKLIEAKKANDPDWNESDGLSKSDRDAILASLANVAPLIQTSTQTFFPAGKISSDSDSVFSQDLTGRQSTPAFSYGVGNAGVLGMPMLVVGMGDANMMTLDAINPKGTKQTLDVFDGNLGRLSHIAEDSEAMNRAVWGSWQTNPFEALSKTFARLMKGLDGIQISEDMARDLTRVFTGKQPSSPDEMMSDSQIREAMRDTQARLNEASLSAEARILTWRKVTHRVDQMAAAGVPYLHKGNVTLSARDSSEAAYELNRIYNEELTKLSSKAAEKKVETSAPVATSTPAPAAAPSPVVEAKPLPGRLDKKTGVRIIAPGSLSALAKSLDLSPTMKAILDQVRLSKRMVGWTIVHGSTDELASWAKETGRELPSIMSQKGGTTHGVTSFGDRTLYLVNPSAETVIHELVHAATYEAVLGVLEGQETDQETSLAVGRIMELMDRFEAMDLSGADLATREAHENALLAIRTAGADLNQSPAARRAGAINEFMAWALANRNLAERGLSGSREEKASALTRMVKSVVSALKSLIFGSGKTTLKTDDLTANLLFNTAVITRSQPALQARLQKIHLAHRTTSGGSRLDQVAKIFTNRIASYLDANPADRPVRETKANLAIFRASELQDLVLTRGFNMADFPMSSQAQAVFPQVVAALATEASIDPAAMSVAQELYTHTMKHLTPEKLMAWQPKPGTAEWDAARHYGQERFNVLTGKYLVKVDESNRSSLLPVFLGLALTHDGFREMLAKLPVPKGVLNPDKTLDGHLENAANGLMMRLSRHLSGTTGAQNVRSAVDALTQELDRVAERQEGLLEKGLGIVNSAMNNVDRLVSESVSNMADKLAEKTGKLDAKVGSKFTKGLAASSRILSDIAREKDSNRVAEAISTRISKMKGFTPIRELMSQMIGRTDIKAAVYDMVKLVRASVSQDRQEFREHVPKEIADSFSRNLSDAEWSTLFRGMGKTDIAALMTGRSVDLVLELLRDRAARQTEIAKLENDLQSQDPQHWNLLQRKAKQLAHYMGTGQPGRNLLRNADAVAHLLDERKDRNRPLPSQDFVEAVDSLVTLYALDDLSRDDQALLGRLVDGEAKGMGFTLSYLLGQRKEETLKAIGPRTRFNHYKGYIPSLQEEGMSLVVASESEAAELLARSYKRVGEYKGSPAESGRERMSYFFAPASSRAAFAQGILQNVRLTAGGVLQNTGYTDGMTAGRIADPDQVKAIRRALSGEGSQVTENLMPIFDATGFVVAYERSVDPVQLARLKSDTHLARMIGVWRGRQVEEERALGFNESLIDALYEMYEKDTQRSAGNRDGYVNLLDPASLDPVTQDATSLFSQRTRRYAESLFGRDQFWVRRDMLNDTIGVRKASVSDLWTGVSRLPEPTQKALQSTLLAVFGNEAYRLTTNAEAMLQEVVKEARRLIVVKSVIVPVANFISNVQHMISIGVPAMNIVRGMPRKLSEVHAYTQGRLQEVSLDARLRAAEAAGEVTTYRQLRAEIQSIRDSYRRMSIWPLIEAGEFSSVSDLGIGREELLLSSGRLHQYVERMVDKLPGGLKTVGRYAIVGRDTALFQGLQRAVEYGDFLAKAIVYDHLRSQGKTQREALGEVTEEFVNYDINPGRLRGYLEDVGLLWFTNYKIGTVKIALRQLRRNPVRAFLSQMLPQPPGLDQGTPLTDNLVSKTIGGSMGYSIGPGMGFRSVGLNPWLNIAN